MVACSEILFEAGLYKKCDILCVANILATTFSAGNAYQRHGTKLWKFGQGKLYVVNILMNQTNCDLSILKCGSTELKMLNYEFHWLSYLLVCSPWKIFSTDLQDCQLVRKFPS